MGFVDLSIADIAEDYGCSVATVMHVCDRRGIRYKDAQTRLPLEDAKAVMQTLIQQLPSDPSD